MRNKIRRIIAEELERIMEGEVVRPDFGGGKPTPKPGPSPFEQALTSIGNVVSEIIDVAGDDMDDDEVSKLEELLDMIDDMQSETTQVDDTEDEFEEDEDEFEDEEPYSGAPTSSERDELSRFKDWMKLQDVD